jgi:hypothetical protein
MLQIYFILKQINIMTLSSLGLEECVRNYDRENTRKDSLESKASYILVAISIFTGIWGTLITYITKDSNISTNFFIIICTVLTIIFIAVCGLYAIRVLRIQDYKYPIEDSNPNNLKQYLSKPENDLRKELFSSYLVCFSENNIKNNKKAEYLQKSEIYLYCFVILSIISIFLVIM